MKMKKRFDHRALTELSRTKQTQETQRETGRGSYYDNKFLGSQ